MKLNATWLQVVFDLKLFIQWLFKIMMALNGQPSVWTYPIAASLPSCNVIWAFATHSHLDGLPVSAIMWLPFAIVCPSILRKSTRKLAGKVAGCCHRTHSGSWQLAGKGSSAPILGQPIVRQPISTLQWKWRVEELSARLISLPAGSSPLAKQSFCSQRLAGKVHGKNQLGF